MSKKSVTQGRDIRLDYQNIMRLSLQVQKYDLILRDCSDITGHLRGNYILNLALKNDLIVKDPYIFKLTKGDVSIILLGTLHSLPIEVYPSNLIKILLQRDTVFTENISGETIKKKAEHLQETLINNSLENSVYEDTAEWFDKMSLTNQNYLVDVCSIVPHKEDTPQNFLQLYYSKSTCDILPMDIYLAYMHHNYFYHSVTALEGYDQTFEASNILSHHKAGAALTNILTYDKENGGVCATPSYLIQKEQYLNGNSLEATSQDDFVIKRNKEWVNTINKYSNFDSSCTDAVKNSLLVIVGVGHLSGNDSVISLMHNEHGYEIERIDLTGDFHQYDL